MRDTNSLPVWVSTPAAVAYGAAVRWRMRLYRWKLLSTRSLDNPVISVGNIVAGGTGKTPIVEYLSRFLLHRGHRVSILSRGYRRSARGVLLVSRGKGLLAAPGDCGDEPYLLARNLPDCWVTVGEDRYAAGRLVEPQLGKCIHVLDDGYQHVRLNRAVNILLLDATNPFGRGHLLPRGRLREPPEAIGRADVIVLTRADHPFDDEALVQQIKKSNLQAFILYAHNQARGLAVVGTRQLLPMRDFFRRKVLAFSGIAQPRLFHELLAHHQVEVVAHFEFGDHHRYRQEEIDRLFREAERIGVDAIVTTEKDEINMQGLRNGRVPCYYLRIEAEFANPSQLEFCLQTVLP